LTHYLFIVLDAAAVWKL